MGLDVGAVLTASSVQACVNPKESFTVADDAPFANTGWKHAWVEISALAYAIDRMVHRHGGAEDVGNYTPPDEVAKACRILEEMRANGSMTLTGTEEDMLDWLSVCAEQGYGLVWYS